MTDQDRAEFEKWSLGVGADECDLVQDDNGDYMSRKTRDYWGVWLAARRTQYEQVRELCGLIKTLHSEELQDRGEVPVLLDDIATLAAQLKEQQDD
jgi:hypothetical protein